MPSNTTPKNGQVKPAAKTANPKKATRAVTPPVATKKAPPKKKPVIQEPVEVEAYAWQERLYDTQPNPYHPPVAPYLWIDYPQQQETLHAPDYVIRLGIGGAEAVELSIDDGDWQACRANSGYWWHDWANISTGPHKLVARMRTPEGIWYRTPSRDCYYEN
jgi:hypothetical protein